MIKWKQEFGNFTSRRKSSGFWNNQMEAALVAIFPERDSGAAGAATC